MQNQSAPKLSKNGWLLGENKAKSETKATLPSEIGSE